MTFKSLPFEARPIRATEAVLERIYQAAKDGLKGDALALAADLLPIELRRLEEFDPFVGNIITKARADNERALVAKYQKMAQEGDAKAIEFLLKYVHKYSAPQSISVEVNNTISIVQALEQAQTRVLEGLIIDEAHQSDNSDRLLSSPVKRTENDTTDIITRPVADDV